MMSCPGVPYVGGLVAWMVADPFVQLVAGTVFARTLTRAPAEENEATTVRLAAGASLIFRIVFALSWFRGAKTQHGLVRATGQPMWCRAVRSDEELAR
jgi:uncharacterized membrane protein (UPF0136 family)